MSARILIVDDDPIQRRNLEMMVLRLGYKTILADGGISALTILNQRKDISVVLLDLSMPDLGGKAVLENLQNAGNTVPVIVLPQDQEIGNVGDTLKLGALDFIPKPAMFERVSVSLLNALRVNALTQEIYRARLAGQPRLQLRDLVCHSAEMESVIKQARHVAQMDSAILLEGEMGCGKETLARAIHLASKRQGAPFIVLDCQSFQTRRSQDTITRNTRRGQQIESCIEEDLAKANGGVLLLRNVSELPIKVQKQLYAHICIMHHNPSSYTIDDNALDIRVIATSIKPLRDLVLKGKFCAELYELISDSVISLPPLRLRNRDIPALAHMFLLKFALEERLSHITGISPQAMALLKEHGWPGNVRELKNAIHRAVLLCNGGELTVEDFRHLDPSVKKKDTFVIIGTPARSLVEGTMRYRPGRQCQIPACS